MGATSEPSVEAILRRAGLRFAYLFGSRTRGEASPGSDADVAVMPARPLGVLEQERLASELARALHVPDVDIVALDRASLELRGRVVQEGRRIYSADEPARVAFEVRTRSEYFDFLPFLRRLERSYLSRVAERGPLMVDPARVRQLLEALEEYRPELERLRDLPAAEYQGDTAVAGRYLVQASARACIDIANHVIASSGWRTPQDFRDSFTVLEENVIIEAGLAERMRALAGLRNRLVHIYAEVDDRIVRESLPQGLQDLSDFSRAMARLASSG